mmetsp:Transcript_45297/g.119687  ORF Transcript_45297/g.119687 Transcript_45297/m.119687 type:complete len:258 (-) Transcript_45297:1765-2538(-)
MLRAEGCFVLRQGPEVQRLRLLVQSLRAQQRRQSVGAGHRVRVPGPEGHLATSEDLAEVLGGLLHLPLCLARCGDAEEARQGLGVVLPGPGLQSNVHLAVQLLCLIPPLSCLQQGSQIAHAGDRAGMVQAEVGLAALGRAPVEQLGLVELAPVLQQRRQVIPVLHGVPVPIPKDDFQACESSPIKRFRLVAAALDLHQKRQVPHARQGAAVLQPEALLAPPQRAPHQLLRLIEVRALGLKHQRQGCGTCQCVRMICA